MYSNPVFTIVCVIITNRAQIIIFPIGGYDTPEPIRLFLEIVGWRTVRIAGSMLTGSGVFVTNLIGQYLGVLGLSGVMVHLHCRG